jgi:hypothetical protein
MTEPNDFHLTGDEDTITIEINSPLMPITSEMRNRPRARPAQDPEKRPSSGPQPNPRPEDTVESE